MKVFEQVRACIAAAALACALASTSCLSGIQGPYSCTKDSDCPPGVGMVCNVDKGLCETVAASDQGTDPGKDLAWADAWDLGSADMVVTEDVGETDSGPGDLYDVEAETDACTPDCTGKECGDDGCGGSCGDCDDSIDCTDDSCDKDKGICLFTPNDTICSDKDVCTGLETCDPSVGCRNGTPLDCEDGNPCTSLDCDTVSGCQYTPAVGTCTSDHPPCTGTCVGTECVFEAETLNGLDDDCDGYLDEDFDLDHDGVCDSLDCTVEAIDTCPTVWNPDNDPALCPEPGDGIVKRRGILLTEPALPAGTSTWRRTNEPVEIPLWNGILDDSVVGYWKFDNGVAFDYSGNGYHGDVQGADIADGAFLDTKGALAFNGNGDVTDIPLLANQTWCPDDLTVSAWVKATIQPERQTVVVSTQLGSPNYTWALQLAASGEALFFWDDKDTSVPVNLYTTSVVADDAWHHVVATLSTDKVMMYVDGRLESMNLPTNPAPCFSNGAGGYFHVGYNQAVHPDELNGSVDEVIVFERALSPNEVAAYYHSMRPYGTNFVPGSQSDFDDIRVTEVSPQQVEHVIPSEVIGVRPHSDTPCPMAEDDGTWADRDDLCGVVGYWKLDGNGIDSSGNDNDAVPINSPDFVVGRFGGNGSGAHMATNSSPNFYGDNSLSMQIANFTIESWVIYNGGGSVSITNNGYYNTANYHFFINNDDNLVCNFNREDESLVSCVGIESVNVGEWTHLACTYDQQAVGIYMNGRLTNSCSETALPYTKFSSFKIGPSTLGTSDGEITIDELLVHSIPKSPDYIYRRANPGVPTVRFLAHTVPYPNLSETYDFLGYALRWGEDGASQVPPIMTGLDQITKCHGLLSPCLGYAGWWRFNEGGGTEIVDETTWRHRCGILGTPEWAAATEGLSYKFDGQSDGIYFHGENKSPAFNLNEFSIEASFLTQVAADGGSHMILHKGLSMDTELSNYWLMQDTDGSLIGAIEYGDDANLSVVSSYPIPVDEWQHATYLHHDSQYELHQNYAPPLTLSSDIEPTVNDWPLYIGMSKRAAGDGWQQFWEGLIDFVRLMSRTLMPDEFLHLPLSGWSLEPCVGDDSDCDGDPDTTDCAPLEPGVFNGAAEVCNNIDDDCDGVTDGEGLCPEGQSCVAGVCLTDGFAAIPAGSFWMGSPGAEDEANGCPDGYTGTCLDELGRAPSEVLHYVKLTHAFEMQAHEVTQGEFETTMGWNPSSYPACGTNCPIETISWYDAAAFANKKSLGASLNPCYLFSDVKCSDGTDQNDDYMACMNEIQNGILSAVVTVGGSPYECSGYRLPTESEWEYAVRAGSNTAFHPSYGNNGLILQSSGCDQLDINLDQIAFYCGNSTATYADAFPCPTWFEGAVNCGPQPVGSKEGNEWGLYDMSGNIWEWVWDRYPDTVPAYPEGTLLNPAIDPLGTESGVGRVSRGGSWNNGPTLCRSSTRAKLLPGERTVKYGFRLSRTL